MSEFNPKQQVQTIKGIGAYLQAKDRIRWFREANGAGAIRVAVLVVDIERGYAAVHATCTSAAGGESQNYGSAWRDVLHKKFVDSGRRGDPNAFAGDFLEFATTAAISRALAGLGYGTDDALDWAIGDYADAPVQTAEDRAAAEYVAYQAREMQGAPFRHQSDQRPAVPDAGAAPAVQEIRPALPTDLSESETRRIRAAQDALGGTNADRVRWLEQRYHVRSFAQLAGEDRAAAIAAFEAEAADVQGVAGASDFGKAGL